MTRKRLWRGSLVGLIGFILSPLSWWNDAFVNIPLAIGFGWLIALVYKPAFHFAVIVGYWLTNILGLILMHKGIQKIRNGDQPKPYTKKDLLRDFAISLVYTGLIVLLLKLKLLQPFGVYLKP